MRAKAYHVLRNVLSQNDRNRLKRRVAHERKRLAGLYRLRYGTFGPDDLRRELAARIPDDAEIIMVHCSVNDLEPMFMGTASHLLDVLVELCGADRTLAMPAFFFGGPEGDVHAHYRRDAVFSARRTPSQMGLLSELFRRRSGVHRSLHPTHSVCALGPLAEELVGTHHAATTSFGADTPFGVMAARRTAIVGIGIEYFRCLTQVHTAEDILGERYPIALRRETIAVELRDVDGAAYPYKLPLGDAGLRRRMDLLEDLLEPDELKQWRFHGVPLFVTSAERVTQALIDAALRRETIYDALPIGRRRPEPALEVRSPA